MFSREYLFLTALLGLEVICRSVWFKVAILKSLFGVNIVKNIFKRVLKESSSGSLLLRHSSPHFPPNSRGVAC